MADHRSATDQFLSQITGIAGEIEFSKNWKAWEQLLAWVRKQPFKDEILGTGKIPGRLIHPKALAEEVSKTLGGPNS